MSFDQPPPRPQRNSVPWAERIMPFYIEWKDSPPSRRQDIVAEATRQMGLRGTTIQRQLAALQFLASHGKDPMDLSPGIPLTSLETVAKIMRLDEEEGRQLLEEVLGHAWSARRLLDHFRLKHPARGSYGAGNSRSIERDGVPERPPESWNRPLSETAGRIVTPAWRLSELDATISLVVARLQRSLQGICSGVIKARFEPEVLKLRLAAGPVEPLFSAEDERGSRGLVFAHDGKFHRHSAAEYAFLLAVSRAVHGGSFVHAYIAAPGDHLLSELRELPNELKGRLDIRRERITVEPEARSFTAEVKEVGDLNLVFAGKEFDSYQDNLVKRQY